MSLPVTLHLLLVLVDMMGNPHEAGGAHDHRPQRAVLPGVTALTGVIVTIVQIVSVAVPNWGYYASSGKTNAHLVLRVHMKCYV